jgi:hypothetical protein
MKKGIKILAFMLLAVFFTGCFASNVDLKAQKIYAREYKGMKIELSRSDLSGIFVDIQNMSNKDITIVWKESTLGGSRIIRHDAIVYPALNDENTVLTELQKKTFVIHRAEDFYYVDPVLYAQSGVRIKPLKFPVELKLVIKTNGDKETLSIFLDNNYRSDEDANSQRYKEDAYQIRKREDAEKLNKDYRRTKINRRDKVDDLPEAKVIKENQPVEDELYINHRK